MQKEFMLAIIGMTTVEFIWFDDDELLVLEICELLLVLVFVVEFDVVEFATLLTNGVTVTEAAKLTNPAIVELNKQFPCEIE